MKAYVKPAEKLLEKDVPSEDGLDDLSDFVVWASMEDGCTCKYCQKRMQMKCYQTRGFDVLADPSSSKRANAYDIMHLNDPRTPMDEILAAENLGIYHVLFKIPVYYCETCHKVMQNAIEKGSINAIQKHYHRCEPEFTIPGYQMTIMVLCLIRLCELVVQYDSTGVAVQDGNRLYDRMMHKSPVQHEIALREQRERKKYDGKTDLSLWLFETIVAAWPGVP